MTSKPSINIIASVQKARALMVNPTVKRPYRIVSGNHAFEIDREVWSFAQVHGTDSMYVVATIRAASWTIDILVDVRLGCDIPGVLVRSAS